MVSHFHRHLPPVSLQLSHACREGGDDGRLRPVLSEHVYLASDPAPAAAQGQRPLQGSGGHGDRRHEGSKDDPGEPLSSALKDQAAPAEGTDFVRLLGDPASPEPTCQRSAVRSVEDLPVGAGPEGGKQDRCPDAG